jgi:hypothetical protein
MCSAVSERATPSRVVSAGGAARIGAGGKRTAGNQPEKRRPCLSGRNFWPPARYMRPGKTKRGKNYAKAPEQLEAVETGQQKPMPPGFPGGSLRATSISCDRCGRSRFSRGSENPRGQPTRFQADPWYSLSQPREALSASGRLEYSLPRFVFPGLTQGDKNAVVTEVDSPDSVKTE